MQSFRRRIVTFALGAALATGISFVPASQAAAAESRHGFNDEYIYATTRDVSDMDAPAGLKLTLYPATIVIDTALLPFAVIAGFVT